MSVGGGIASFTPMLPFLTKVRFQLKKTLPWTIGGLVIAELK